jgi:hypothetical protein
MYFERHEALSGELSEELSSELSKELSTYDCRLSIGGWRIAVGGLRVAGSLRQPAAAGCRLATGVSVDDALRTADAHRGPQPKDLARARLAAD